MDSAPVQSDAPATGVQVRKGAIFFILMTVLLDVMALGVIIPVWPQLIEGFTGSPAGAGLWVGLSGGVWCLMQFVSQPIAGALSDRFGRRPVVLGSNLGTGLDYVFMALAPNLWWLMAGRVISGIAASSISTAFAYIADVTAPEKRAGAFGLAGATFGLAFVLGPLLGGVLGDAHRVIALPGGFELHGDPRLPFWVAAGFSLLNFAYGCFVLPESLPRERRDHFRWSRANPVGSLNLLRAHPDLLPLATVNFLAQFAHYALQTVFVLYAADRYHWPSTMLGVALAVMGVSAFVVQGGLTGLMVKLVGERVTMLLALLCGTAGFAIYGLAPTGTLFLVGVPIMALWGMAGPSAQALMSRRVSVSEQGKLQGANMSLASIAGIFAPMLYGGLYALFNGRWASLGLPGAPFLAGAGFLLLAAGFAFRAARGARRAEPATAAA